MTDKQLLSKWRFAIRKKAKSFNSEYTDDLEEIGKITVLACKDSFEEEKGLKFSTYVHSKMEQAMKDELRKLGWFGRKYSKKNQMLPLADGGINKELIDTSAEELILSRERTLMCRDAMAVLSDIETQVIEYMYWNGMSLLETASVMGFSESRISQIHKKALSLLKEKLDEDFTDSERE